MNSYPEILEPKSGDYDPKLLKEVIEQVGRQIPKQWKDCSGRLRHFIAEVKQPDGEALVISKSWKRRWQQWVFHAETRSDVEFQRKITHDLQA